MKKGDRSGNDMNVVFIWNFNNWKENEEKVIVLRIDGRRVFFILFGDFVLVV